MKHASTLQQWLGRVHGVALCDSCQFMHSRLPHAEPANIMALHYLMNSLHDELQRTCRVGEQFP